mmetsp:Transcript_20845/g.33440  ORF Transcript_20845/g.33440 Transcript_20845/m.33440 type:complete len:286 (-) Transcript_20845:323-1180(-)
MQGSDFVIRILPNMTSVNAATSKTFDSTVGRRLSDTGIRYHDVEPLDTIQSICSKYDITARELRQANFALNGSNVQGGPKRLIIPPSAGKNTDHHQQRQEQHQEGVKEPEHRESADDADMGDLERLNINNTVFDKGVLYHRVEPSDTMRSICSKYGITAPALRRANVGLSGSNVHAQNCPKRLIIPVSKSDDQHTHQEQRRDEIKKPIVKITEAQVTECKEDTTGVIRYHDVQPSDSIQYICLKYRVAPRDLRSANNFKGNNLRAAPARLVIPQSVKKNTENASN